MRRNPQENSNAGGISIQDVPILPFTILAFFLGFLAHCPSNFADIYVSTTGADSSAGTLDSPYRTVAHALKRAEPGTSVIILPGVYKERVRTTRGGTSDDRRITLRGQGEAILRGITIEHPFVSVERLQFTGHSSADRNTGYIEVLGSGDHFRILDTTIRDGTSLILSDLYFHAGASEGDILHSDTAEFARAGFEPGMHIKLLKSLKNQTPANKDTSRLILSVNSHRLILKPEAKSHNEGPISALVSASHAYGIFVSPGASYGVVHNCKFRNLDYDAAFFGGETNLYTSNVFERCNGWEAMHFSGIGNVFRHNIIKNSPAKSFSNISPDVFETFGGAATREILFEYNFVEGFDGVLGMLRSGTQNNISNIVFRNNVFVQTGWFGVRVPGVSFINNTFVNVATHSSAVVESSPHVIRFMGASMQPSGHNGLVLNNIFVGCGEASRHTQLHGWYEHDDSVMNFSARHNFVSGPAPDYSSKVGFPEGNPRMNGGNPRFLRAEQPLGPDELPFTADDGLQLRADSPLLTAGEHGTYVGAYSGKPMPPKELRTVARLP